MSVVARSNVCNRPSSGGFTLVEVLVALVVLAVGLLGIAGLYVTALRSGGGSINRMKAINLAEDMADRIRANRLAGADAAYGGAAANNGCVKTGTFTVTGAAVGCTADQMAADDLWHWTTDLAAMLPGGTGAIAVVGAAYPYTYQITVTWTESGNQTSSYQMNLQI